MTFAIIYGCTPQNRKLATTYLKQMKGLDQALHPLLLPMLFAEIERKRLFNLLERERTKLQQRLLEMDIKLRGEIVRVKENGAIDSMAATGDCESTKLWIAVSSLKNGLMALETQLANLIEHSRMLSKTLFRPQADGTDDHAQERSTGELIEARLLEMLAEFESKIWSFDSVLGGMAMATQMVRLKIREWPWQTMVNRCRIVRNGTTIRDKRQDGQL